MSEWTQIGKHEKESTIINWNRWWVSWMSILTGRNKLSCVFNEKVNRQSQVFQHTQISCALSGISLDHGLFNFLHKEGHKQTGWSYNWISPMIRFNKIKNIGFLYLLLQKIDNQFEAPENQTRVIAIRTTITDKQHKWWKPWLQLWKLIWTQWNNRKSKNFLLFVKNY